MSLRGEPTATRLDDAVLALLQERCSAKNSEQENLRAVYDFIAHDITYRPGTADTSGGFSDELTEQLALELLHKSARETRRAGALMAVCCSRWDMKQADCRLHKEGADRA